MEIFTRFNINRAHHVKLWILVYIYIYPLNNWKRAVHERLDEQWLLKISAKYIETWLVTQGGQRAVYHGRVIIARRFRYCLNDKLYAYSSE